jgi:hypothetical protein
MPDIDFLMLPWEIQGALASGYAAYATAYTGLRDRQRPIYIAFLSLVFSVPATLIFGFMAGLGIGPAISIPAAFVAAVAVGIIWPKFIQPHVFPFLRILNVTWSNDDPSALATISSNYKFRVSQVAVLLDDGTWLRCDDAIKFENAPFGPYVLGPNGDIGLYLTHEEPAGSEAKILNTVRDDHYGDRIAL